jgi:hypothetical protein
MYVLSTWMNQLPQSQLVSCRLTHYFLVSMPLCLRWYFRLQLLPYWATWLIAGLFLLSSSARAEASRNALLTHAATLPALATVLRADGSLCPGVTGSFNAHAYALATAPDGHPVFRPAATLGAGDEPWQNLSANGIIEALVIASNGDVYVGGRFSQVGSVSAYNVAKWNGTTWSSLDTGISNGTDGLIFALALASNGDLYVGGVFGNAGGVAAPNVAKWNGVAWSSLGSGASNDIAPGSTASNGAVHALAIVSNGDVYVGGSFSLAGGLPVNNVAKWNGTVWSSLGTGTSNGVTSNQRAVPATIYALAAAGTSVYLCGAFTQAGGTTASGVVKWNGSFSTLGSAFSIYDTMLCLAVASDGDVYVGGQFTQAGGVAARGVARWNGTTWSSVGGGPNNYVYALALTSTGDLYAGGLFTTAGSTPVSNVAKWNGSAWSSLGTGLSDRVFALGLRTSGASRQVVAGGAFISVGDASKSLRYLASYTEGGVLAVSPPSSAATMLTLYPVPAHAAVEVTLPALVGVTQVTLRLRDALGRVVLLRTAALPAGGLQQELPVSGLCAGSYVLEVQAGAQRFTRHLLLD